MLNPKSIKREKKNYVIFSFWLRCNYVSPPPPPNTTTNTPKINSRKTNHFVKVKKRLTTCVFFLWDLPLRDVDGYGSLQFHVFCSSSITKNKYSIKHLHKFFRLAIYCFLPFFLPSICSATVKTSIPHYVTELFQPFSSDVKYKCPFSFHSL